MPRRSIAGTSQLYNPTKKWDYDLIKLLGLPQKLFKELSDSGSTLGKLSRLISSKTGLKNTNVMMLLVTLQLVLWQSALFAPRILKVVLGH